MSWRNAKVIGSNQKRGEYARNPNGYSTVRINGSPVRREKSQAIELLATNFTVVGKCHEWNGGRTKGGYPLVSYEGKTHYAHRLALEKKIGELIGDFESCHSCDNPPCINPEHLFKGTHQQNMADSSRKGRATTRPRRGSENVRAKLTENMVRRMRNSRNSGSTFSELGKRFKVSRSAAFYACNYGWKHI